MELTLESALSNEGLIGHATYLLLVVSMLMRNMIYLRIVVILSALVGITYSSVILHDPVGTFWESLLVAVNIVQLTITFFLSRRARFSDEEADFMHGCFPDLNPALRRKLLNCGKWTWGDHGKILTVKGRPVTHLIYLAKGTAFIESDGEVVGMCGAGTFLGEMTVISGEPATGTATLGERSRYWAIESGVLRKLMAKSEIRQAIESAFSRGMREKLIRSNEFIVQSGGVRTRVNRLVAEQPGEIAS